MRKLLVIALLAVPFIALSLDYSDSSEQYTDANTFNTAESAGISLLTNIGAVSGNPDGTFMPRRTLNRAEFLKIAMLSHPDIAVLGDDAEDCFPDVRRDHWFSPYVCLAKRRGSVGGYPDGFFRPGNPVNYAEALKMLGELHGITAEVPTGSPWYMAYAEGARRADVALRGGVAYDHLLTRGEMARLAAAYVAYTHGELSLYRQAERGMIPSSSSSVSSSSSSISSISSSSSSSVSSESSASSMSSTPSPHDFPARSRFLVAGERSHPIASATFFANLEPVLLTRAEVKFEQEFDGADALFLLDRDGVEIGQLFLDKTFDSTEKTWRGSFTPTYRIEKGQQKVLGIEVRLKPRNQGATSEELVEVDRFTITTQGEWSTNSYTSGTDAGPFPQHQTSMGRITWVRNAQEETGLLPLGPGQLLAGFRITGSAVDGVTLAVEHLEFSVSKPSTVTIVNWQLGIPDSNDRWPCSVSGTTVSCSSIPVSLGTLGTGQSARVFRLFGDVSLESGATDKTVQVTLNLAGNLSTNGAVRWTDGTGHFNWVELDQPLARSTRWE